MSTLAMPNLDVWQWLLLAGGAYIAIVALARLMKQRHDALVAELTQQTAEEQRKRKAKEKKRKQQPKAA